MAFWSRQRQPNALLASAHKISLDRDSADAPRPYDNWQDEAWHMYGDDDYGNGLGEYRQGVTWLGNVISRARLIPAMAPQNPGDEPTPIDPDTDDPAAGLVKSIAGGIGGQSELLRSGAIHLTVPGEGWFIGEVNTDDDPELAQNVAWSFLSRDEVRHSQGNRERIQVRTDATTWKTLPPESLPIRVWRRHERYHWKADSSTRAALPIMRRLELLNRKVDAQITSRLASNGMYWIPEEMDFPAKEAYKDADDPFVAELIDLASIAIKTPGSAMASIPLFLRAKGDEIKNLRRDVFADLIDPELRVDREFEIRRLATAMDVPPEVLLGMAGMNHWGAWQVEESALKTTVTSLLELICWSMTTGYLNPALKAMRAGPTDQDVDFTQQRIVWYDLSELAVRTDRSADAITLHQNLTITDEAEMRETGFDETDLLTDPVELRRRIGLKIVSQPQASTLEIGLELLGIETVAKVTIEPSEPAPVDVDIESPGPMNPGDLPRDDGPRAAPDTNGDQPVETIVIPG